MATKESSYSSVLLHNDAAEQSVLGTILLCGNRAFEKAMRRLTAVMFYQPQHMSIYGIMMDLYTSGNDIEMSNVAVKYAGTEEGKTNLAYITSLCEFNSTANLEDYIQEIVNLYKRRRTREIALKLADVGVSMEQDTEEAIEEAIEEIKRLDDNPDMCISSFANALQEVKQTITDNETGNRSCGLPTGFNSIDERGGFHLSDLVVVAAESSQGKTSFAMDVAVHVAKSGVPVAIYSMEMQQAQLAARILANSAEVNSRLIMGGMLNDNDMIRINRSIAKLRDLPIYFDDNSTISINKIYSSIRTLKRRKGIKMAVIDYLQILSTTQRIVNLETFYGEVSRKLKNLAKELDVCIVLLSQLSRSYDNPEPSVSRLRGSGQINEASDMTFLIYRPEVYNRNYSGEYEKYSTKGTALIKCAKGRNVGVYTFLCGFNAERTHFYDLTYPPRRTIQKIQ